MSDQPLFREEAVEHIRRERGGGDVVRIAPRWTSIAVWALGAIALAGLVAASLIQVDQVRLVPAVADTGSRVVRAVVPEGTGVAVRPGLRAQFSLTETGDRVDVRITRVGAPQGVGSGPRAIPVLARADAPSAGGAGVLELKVGQRPLIAQIIPGSSSQR